jgi:hypothetical protein
MELFHHAGVVHSIGGQDCGRKHNRLTTRENGHFVSNGKLDTVDAFQGA